MSLSLLLLACAPLVGPQESQSTYQTENANQRQEALKYQSLDELISMELPLQSQTGQQPRDPAIGGERGRETGLAGQRGQQVQVEDFIMKGDGSIGWAAVSTQGLAGAQDRTVLVPADRIQHRIVENELKCELAMSPQQLQSMAEFDLRTAKRDGAQLITMIRAADASFDSEARAMEASARQPELHLASEMLGLEVRGSDGEFGKVDDAIVNIENHKAEYLIVAHGQMLGMGGDRYIIPHGAVSMRTVEDEPVLVVENKTVEELEQCVEYEKPEEGFIDPKVLKKVDQEMSGSRSGAKRNKGEGSRDR
ncbi:MAG: PRC-barrel domain-containing protein [Planctomycetota bacterium]